MICLKCNKFNMSDDVYCQYCGSKLVSNQFGEQFKTFVGNKTNIDENDATKVWSNRAKDSANEELNATEYGEEISFDGEFAFGNGAFGDDERIVTRTEKVTLRNTALLAVLLAILIDAVITVSLIVYFRGFAQKIVNVSKQAVAIEQSEAFKG